MVDTGKLDATCVAALESQRAEVDEILRRHPEDATAG
jgi:hypothetical protein